MVHGSLRRPAARGGASHAFQEQVRGGTCDTILLLCIPVVSAVADLPYGCSRTARGARDWAITDHAGASFPRVRIAKETKRPKIDSRVLLLSMSSLRSPAALDLGSSRLFSGLIRLILL